MRLASILAIANLTPSLELELMCSASADTLRQMKPRNSKKNKLQHWSPALLALQAHLCFITEVRRGLDGHGNKKSWGWLRNKKLAEAVDRWYKALSHLTFENKEQKLELMSWTGHGPSYWKNSKIKSSQMMHAASSDYLNILNSLHTKKRIYYRQQFSTRCKQIEKMRQQEKTGKLIRALTNKPYNKFEMDLLYMPDGSVNSNPFNILEFLTNYFKEWHTGDQNQSTGIHDPDTDWQNILINKQYFLDKIKDLGIDADLIELLWSSLQYNNNTLDGNVN